MIDDTKSVQHQTSIQSSRERKQSLNQIQLAKETKRIEVKLSDHIQRQ
jgi:hypothetical protein